MRSHRVAAAVVVFLAAGRAAAGTIDTQTFDGQLSTLTESTLGGTFPADDIHLQSFTLILSFVGAGPATVAAQVYATDAGGTPVGGPLYTSAPFALTGAPFGYTFTPNVFLTPGERYWIGATSLAAQVAGTSGVFNTAVVAFSDPLPTSQVWFTEVAGAPTTPFPADISSLIVMNPEPGTLALFGLGALGLGIAVRRRRAQRASGR